MSFTKPGGFEEIPCVVCVDFQLQSGPLSLLNRTGSLQESWFSFTFSRGNILSPSLYHPLQEQLMK